MSSTTLIPSEIASDSTSASEWRARSMVNDIIVSVCPLLSPAAR
jgi:hypothetical protein